MNKDFWHKKRVLVTGHTGFKGSWLSLWLQEMGANVFGYSLPPPTEPSLFQIANVESGMQSMIADINDPSTLEKAFNAFAPEIVFHLAAQPLVRYSYDNPVETYMTNVMGTLYVLEAIRKVGSVRSAIMITTDKCYENKEWCWGYRENEPMGGYDPYSSSKGCAELLIASYRRSYFSANDRIGIASARAGNVIGGGDWAKDRLIPDIINAIREQEPITIRHPHAIRPWQHVLEPLSGYLLLAEKLYENPSQFAEAWNFGPHEQDAKPVSWIAENLKALSPHYTNDIRVEKNDALHEANYLKLDCSKAKAYLKWQPRWNLENTLQHITSWYSALDAGLPMREVTLQQINAYVGEIK